MTKFTNKPVLLFSFVFLQELQESRALTNMCMCRVDSTISVVWKAPLPIEGVLDFFLSSPCFFSFKKVPAFNTNKVDSDQTPRSAASDLGLHCLALSLL